MTWLLNGALGRAAGGTTAPTWIECMRHELSGGHKPIYGCSPTSEELPADQRILLGIEATRRLADVVWWLQAIAGNDEGLTFAVILDACDTLCSESEDASTEPETAELRRDAIAAACSLLDLVENYGVCRRVSSARHWLSGVVNSRVGCRLANGLALHRRGRRGARALWRVDDRPTYEMVQGENGRWHRAEIAISGAEGIPHG